VLTSDTCLEFVRHLVDEACLIIPDASALSLLDPSKVDHASLCLVEGRVTTHTAQHLQACGITRILTTKGARQAVTGWTPASWTADHCRLGGVTIEAVTGACYAYGSQAPVGISYPASVGRDVSTVLSIKAPARIFWPPPANTVVEPLGCEKLRTSAHPF
jgi:hypothetical protein